MNHTDGEESNWKTNTGEMLLQKRVQIHILKRKKKERKKIYRREGEQ